MNWQDKMTNAQHLLTLAAELAKPAIARGDFPSKAAETGLTCLANLLGVASVNFEVTEDRVYASAVEIKVTFEKI